MARTREALAMTTADGKRPQSDDGAVLDEETTHKVRRFLEVIAGVEDEPAVHGVPRIGIDPETTVTRFAWACEELNVAFGGVHPADTTVLAHLVDHGVDATLREIYAKAEALLAAIDSASDSANDVHDR
jgi:hypothetical protein